MKKSIAILCAILIAASCLALAGCSSKEIPADSPYIGTWKATKATFKDEEVSMDEVLESGGSMIFTLKADGTAEFTDGTEKDTAVWSITNKGIKIKLDSAKSSMKFTAEGDALVTKMLGFSIYLEKTTTVSDVANDVSGLADDVSNILGDIVSDIAS